MGCYINGAFALEGMYMILQKKVSGSKITLIKNENQGLTFAFGGRIITQRK